MVSQNFKGKMRQIISYKGSDGQEKTIENVTDFFAAILVRVVDFNELYDAWEQQFISFIDEFNPESYEEQGAESTPKKDS